jgi:hypothetical protein
LRRSAACLQHLGALDGCLSTISPFRPSLIQLSPNQRPPGFSIAFFKRLSNSGQAIPTPTARSQPSSFTPTSTVTHHNVPTSNQIVLRLLPIELGAKRTNLRLRQ